MTYALIENGSVAEYPVYEGEIRLRHPNISFPSLFQPPEGYVAVADAPRPQGTYAQNVEDGPPVFEDDVWTRQWVVTEASEEQIAERMERQWKTVRAERTKRLSACDWTQLNDAPLTDAEKQTWADYRQALRDLPSTNSNPFAIEVMAPATGVG